MAESNVMLKPRVAGPCIKIAFEMYHALRPYHRKMTELSLPKSAFALFFVALRWYFFLKRLINDKQALNAPLTVKEKLSLFLSIMGHLLILRAQAATSEGDAEEVVDKGPFAVIRYPHRLGKWVSESAPGIYQNNKVSMAIACITFGFMIKGIAEDDAKRAKDSEYEAYKRRVPHRLIPGVY